VNLTFDAWFSVIDPNQTSEEVPVSLHDHLLWQPWFIWLEPVTCNKTIIVTTKPNLLAAHAWVDANLEPMICKSMPSDVELPPSHVLPCRLDKPMYTATSCTYANILKQQFSLKPTTTTTTHDNTQPPRKRQATVIDYDSDQTESQSTTIAVASSNSTNHSSSSSSNLLPPSSATKTDYATDLQSLKNEIQALRTLLNHTMEQIKNKIASIWTPPEPSAMEIDASQSQNPCQKQHQPPTDISSLIHDLKYKIATFVIKTCALLQKQSFPMTQNNHLSSKT